MNIFLGIFVSDRPSPSPPPEILGVPAGGRVQGARLGSPKWAEHLSHDSSTSPDHIPVDGSADSAPRTAATESRARRQKME